jgi:hypothetical protein
MRTPLELALIAAVALSAIPVVLANDWFSLDCTNENKLHCPCHPDHCTGIGPPPMSSDVTGTFGMLDQDTHTNIAYPPGVVDLGADAGFLVKVVLTNASPGVDHTITVGVEDEPGISWTSATNTSVLLNATHNATTVQFNFTLASVWADGDHIFPVVALGENGSWSHAYFAIETNNASASPTPATSTPSTTGSTPTTSSLVTTSTPRTPGPGALAIALAAGVALLVLGRRSRQ